MAALPTATDRPKCHDCAVVGEHLASAACGGDTDALWRALDEHQRHGHLLPPSQHTPTTASPGCVRLPCAPDGYATPLLLCARHKFVDGVRILLDYGVDPDEQMSDGATALYAAAQSDAVRCVAELLKRGAVTHLRLTSGPAEGSSPLLVAVQYASVAVVRLLLEAGAPPTGRFRGRSAIDLAVAHDQAAIIEPLLAACDKVGAVVDLCQPVAAAARLGHLSSLRALAPRASRTGLCCTSLSALLFDPFTPLGIAAYSGHLHVVRWLLCCDVAVGGPGTPEWTAACLAALKGSTDVVRALLAVAKDANQLVFSLAVKPVEGKDEQAGEGRVTPQTVPEFAVDAALRTLVPLTDTIRAGTAPPRTVVRLDDLPTTSEACWGLIVRAMVQTDDWKRRRTVLLLRLLRDRQRCGSKSDSHPQSPQRPASPLASRNGGHKRRRPPRRL